MPSDFGKMQAGNAFQEGDRLLCQDGHRRQRAGSSLECLSERADCEVWGNFSAVAIHGQKGSREQSAQYAQVPGVNKAAVHMGSDTDVVESPRVFGNTRHIWVELEGKLGASWQGGYI